MELSNINLKNEIKGKYEEENKKFPARIGIMINNKDIKAIVAVYDDIENNKTKIIFGYIVDNIKEEIICKIEKDTKIAERINYLKKIMPDAKELFKIIKSIAFGNYMIDSFKRHRIEIELLKEEFYYWVYSNIYYGCLDKETFLTIIKIGNYILSKLTEDDLDEIIHNFIKKGLNKDPYFQLFV